MRNLSAPRDAERGPAPLGLDRYARKRWVGRCECIGAMPMRDERGDTCLKCGLAPADPNAQDTAGA